MDRLRVYTVKEVADILHISPKTMYQIIKDGGIDKIKVRGQIRITSTALEHYLQGDNHEEKGTKR